MVRRVSKPNPTLGKSFASLLVTARAGSVKAQGRLLEECRQYLLLVANAEMDSALGVKLAASDLVQDTFLEAHRDFAHFQGQTEQELLAWLRRILAHNLRDAARRYRESARRAIGREVPLPQSDEDAAQYSPLVSHQTPSWMAMRRERVEGLVAALAQLPDESRQVIVLRNLQALSFSEIGQTMNRSPDAARKLWARSIQRLEALLDATDAR
jgi:RNA polymerase sigma-70 factor (ECF subfamily)